jgi:hypothetical protein
MIESPFCYTVSPQGANLEEEGTALGAIKSLVSQLALKIPDSSSILLEHTKYCPPNHRPSDSGTISGVC